MAVMRSKREFAGWLVVLLAVVLSVAAVIGIGRSNPAADQHGERANGSPATAQTYPAHANPLGAPLRAGARKATPVTRGQDLGFKFRPDERALPYGPVISPSGADPRFDEQADFRPVKPRRRPTYEELQAREDAGQTMSPPALPYPMLPPLTAPIYPGYPPGW